jgi:hypothetical protein
MAISGGKFEIAIRDLHKTKMRLDNHVQTPSPDKATGK